MHWRFWRRGQRAEILAALSLVLSQRRPLIPGLEALAASDPGLQHLLVPLMTALRRDGEIHLNQTLYRLGYLDAEESRLLELAMAQDRTHECLESLSWRQRVGGVNMALIRWFPVWVVLSMVVGFIFLSVTSDSFGKIYRELGLKLPRVTVFLLDAPVFCLGSLMAIVLFAIWILWRERNLGGPGSATFWCPDTISRHLLLRIVQESRWNIDLHPDSPLVQESRRRETQAWKTWMHHSRWCLDPILKTELSMTQDSVERLRRLGFFSHAHGPSPKCWSNVEEDLTKELHESLEYRKPIFLGIITLIGVTGLGLGVIGYMVPLFHVIMKLGAW